MRRLHAACLALLLALGAGTASAAPPGTLAEASAQSLAAGQPILIEIGTTW